MNTASFACCKMMRLLICFAHYTPEKFRSAVKEQIRISLIHNIQKLVSLQEGHLHNFELLYEPNLLWIKATFDFRIFVSGLESIKIQTLSARVKGVTVMHRCFSIFSNALN